MRKTILAKSAPFCQKGKLYPGIREAGARYDYTGHMRDTLILIGLALVAVVIGMFIYLANHGNLALQTSASSGLATAPGTPVQISTLAAGSHSSVTTRTNFIITSEDQLRELWKMTDAAGGVPVVDFGTESVIAVFAGTQTTAGYSIAISSVADTQTKRSVTISLTKPGGSCVVAEVITNPYEIVEVPATTLSLAHSDVTQTASCLQ